MTQGSFVVLSAALGSRLGLFDVMARLADSGPCTSNEIAEEANCKERYAGMIYSTRIHESQIDTEMILYCTGYMKDQKLIVYTQLF